MRTSRDFWAGLVATYKVLTTLPLVECSQVRQLERKEEMRACPATTKTNLTEHRTWALAGILPFFGHNARFNAANRALSVEFRAEGKFTQCTAIVTSLLDRPR